MKIEMSKVGEVVLNKLNGKRYIVDSITTASFTDVPARAMIRPYKWSEDELMDELAKKGLAIGEEDGVEAAEAALELVITSVNAKLYRHLFNTVKAAVYSTVTVENGKLVVDEKVIETGEIIPDKIVGTLPGFVLVSTIADSEGIVNIYAYDVKNDAFIKVSESDEYTQGRSAYEMKRDDKTFYVIASIEVKPIMEEDEDGKEIQTGETKNVVYLYVTEYKDNLMFAPIDCITFDSADKIENPKALMLEDEYFVLVLSSDTQIKTIVYRGDSFAKERSNTLPSIPVYIGRRGSYSIGQDYVQVTDRTYKTDTKDLVDNGCVISFETRSNDDGFEMSFTNESMTLVKTMTIKDTSDRGRIIKIA